MKTIKNIAGLLLLFVFSGQLNAQNLIHIPALTGKGHDSDSGTSFLFSTLNTSAYGGVIVNQSYTQSIQIADADEPWPPRWYTNLPYRTYAENIRDSAEGKRRYDFMIDAKIADGYLAFSETSAKVKDEAYVSKEADGYILLNKKYEVVDTVVSITPSKIFWHQLSINKAGERLISVISQTKLDLRPYTNNQADAAVHSGVDVIQVVKNGSVVFSWNPIEKLEPGLFKFNEKLHCVGCEGDKDWDINWTQLTSAAWDFDGNILYCLREIGIGKISRKDGKVLWQLNTKDLPNNSDKTLDWFRPQDFNPVADNDSETIYSLYSVRTRGQESSKHKGVIFKVNKRTNEVKLVKAVTPEIEFKGDGDGSFEYDGKANYVFYFFPYGGDATSQNDREALEYTKNDTSHVIYKLPAKINAYKVHKLKGWPRPPRPVVNLKNGMLEVQGNWKNVVWYILEGPTNQKVSVAGTGLTIKPKAGEVYCVEAQYGIGHVVSKAFKMN